MSKKIIKSLAYVRVSAMSASLIAIVPAAGVGARARPAGAPAMPKQYCLLAGEPMLRHSVRALLADPRVGEVRVAVSPADPWVAAALAGLPRTVWRACGGATRAQTVANALADAGAADDDWILVHDAARPGLPADALARLIDACLAAPEHGGGLLALPVADTVKAHATAGPGPGPGPGLDGNAVATGAGVGTGTAPDTAADAAVPAGATPARVARTVARVGLWLAQTPQMFRAGALKRALQDAREAGLEVTDEASALEAAGQSPLLVRGALRNFKVTWPEDFDLMEKWL